MKIRLKVTTPAGHTTLFDHPGPVVRIGRDPSCELTLEGEDAGKAASRMHARIELEPDAVRLIDTNSANKTLLNHTPIEQAVFLKVGDRIQIGHTGATLDVLDFELKPTGTSVLRRIDARILLAVGGVVVASLMVLATIQFWPRRPVDTPAPTTPGKIKEAGPEDIVDPPSAPEK